MNYSYYELAVQRWCTQDWNLHGLWPQFTPSTYPTYCEEVVYKPPTGEILVEMQQSWNQCGGDLWEHEWLKHGSCVMEQEGMVEDTFFNRTLQLFYEYFDLTEKCTGQDCTVGCFDLDLEPIECP